MTFTLDEVRRLTGPNLLSDYPGAIADVFFEGVAPEKVHRCWEKHLSHCKAKLSWPEELQSFHRFYQGGMSLSISAPMDKLYSACDLLELAWDLCVQELSAKTDQDLIDVAERLEAIQETMGEETCPALLALINATNKQGVMCLADDDEVSLGTGPSAQIWPIDGIPSPDEIDFNAFENIPVALITGTNGKSTSVRLAAQIAKSANINAGLTSTDFIKVGEEVIDEGDYSGPGGARMLLRDTRTEMAFLEVARGGLLRRGLPLAHAKAALVTNVASDHLGQYGINTVDEIAQVKTMVAKAISPAGGLFEQSGGTLVLNADDERLCQIAPSLRAPICWFSPDPNNPRIAQALKQGEPCAYVKDACFVYSYCENGQAYTASFGRVSDAPMTLRGTAQHNIQNALGVICLCKALGIANDAIVSGLKTFSSSAKDNPGRGNVYEINGVTCIVDFAHNRHSMDAVMRMAMNMQAQRIHVLFSHAGDRSNKEMTDVADAVLKLHPTTFCLAEIKEYLRGREFGETNALVEKHLLEQGIAQEKIVLAQSPSIGTKALMQKARVGDLVLLFVLSEREEVQNFLSSLHDGVSG